MSQQRRDALSPRATNHHGTRSTLSHLSFRQGHALMPLYPERLGRPVGVDRGGLTVTHAVGGEDARGDRPCRSLTRVCRFGGPRDRGEVAFSCGALLVRGGYPGQDAVGLAG